MPTRSVSVVFIAVNRFCPATAKIVPRCVLLSAGIAVRSLGTLSLSSLKGKRVILNIFPSLDTGVCAMSVRKFNQLAASLPDTVVLAISKDLPFAHARFCTVEGIENLVPLSDFRHSDFDENYGVLMADGPLQAPRRAYPGRFRASDRLRPDRKSTRKRCIYTFSWLRRLNRYSLSATFCQSTRSHQFFTNSARRLR